MRKLSLLVAASFLLAAGVASAQPKKGGGGAAAQPASGGNAGGKVKVYDFSGDTIEGDLIKPEGLDVNARDFAKHSSLIRIRTHFIDQILKSAEDL